MSRLSRETLEDALLTALGTVMVVVIPTLVYGPEILVAKDVITTIIMISGVLLGFSLTLYGFMAGFVGSSIDLFMRAMQLRMKKVLESGELKSKMELLNKFLKITLETTTWFSLLKRMAPFILAIFSAFSALILLSVNESWSLCIPVGTSFVFMWGGLIRLIRGVSDYLEVHKAFLLLSGRILMQLRKESAHPS